MRIDGSNEGIRLHLAHGGRTRHVATQHEGRVRDKSTDADVRPAALRSGAEIERHGEGANRALRRQLKDIVHAVRDELKQLAGQSGDDEGAGGKIDADLRHALRRLDHEFRHAVGDAYRAATANGTIDGEALQAAVRSEFEGLLDEVTRITSTDGIAESPQGPESDAGVSERLQALAGRIEELLAELESLLPGPAAQEQAVAAAPSGGTTGSGFTLEIALTLYTDSRLSSDARAPDSGVDSVV